MENFLKETLKILAKHNIAQSQIEWVQINKKWENWKELKKMINFTYDSGYGIEIINKKLKIVGKDWWLERSVYDGSEWWELKKIPIKPTTHGLNYRDLFDSPYISIKNNIAKRWNKNDDDKIYFRMEESYHIKNEQRE